MLEKSVSIIVPIYNSEKYLAMCIESLIGQTYKKIEIVLVDDGSTDESLSICNYYAAIDERIKVFHQENGGVSAARNYGIEVSSGDYITFVDSDDELTENAIAFLVNDIECFDADISTAAEVHIDVNNEIPEEVKSPSVVDIFVGTQFLKMSLNFDRKTTSCHGKLFRREIISDIRFEIGKRINEDFFFVFLCCMKKPIVSYRAEGVYKYYFRENSASRTAFSEKYFDMVYFAGLKKQMVLNSFPEFTNDAICMEVSTHLFLLNLLCVADKKYRGAEKESIKIIREQYRHYKTENQFERRLSWIVSHRLYWGYKMAMRWKFR